MEEMPELAEPQIEASLEAVTETVSSVAASVDVLDTPSGVTSKGEGGLGDSRPPGPLGEGENIIPALGTLGGALVRDEPGGVRAAVGLFQDRIGSGWRNFARRLRGQSQQAAPDRRSGAPDKEQRLYMTWRAGTLEAFDRTLLAQAGIPHRRASVLQFFPEEVEDQLAWMEMENGKRPQREGVSPHGLWCPSRWRRIRVLCSWNSVSGPRLPKTICTAIATCDIPNASSSFYSLQPRLRVMSMSELYTLHRQRDVRRTGGGRFLGYFLRHRCLAKRGRRSDSRRKTSRTRFLRR